MKYKDFFKKYFNLKYFGYIIKNKKWTIFLVWLSSALITYVLYKVYHVVFKGLEGDVNWLIRSRRENNWKDLPPPVDQDLSIPEGFVGGCEGYGKRPGESIFDNLPMKGNHDNDDSGVRMMRGWWPEFNWFEHPNDSTRKVYERVNQDISRLLYTNEGEILSFICPQRGKCTRHIGCLKVEITVSKVKGWIDEKNKKCSGYFEGYLTIWIDKYDIKKRQGAMQFILDNHPEIYNLPMSKQKGIIVPYGGTEKEGADTTMTEFRDNNNISPNLHKDAFMVVSLSAHVKEPIKTGNNKVDIHNQLILDIANIYTTNMLIPGNILNWDIYLTKPELVDKEEYMKHVDKMRISYQICDESCGPGWDGFTINEYGEKVSIQAEVIDDIIIKFKSKL